MRRLELPVYPKENRQTYQSMDVYKTDLFWRTSLNHTHARRAQLTFRLENTTAIGETILATTVVCA